MCGCLSCAPSWGPDLKPRHVPWLGIEAVTLWSAGWCSIHWATPARAPVICSLTSYFLNFLSLKHHVNNLSGTSNRDRGNPETALRQLMEFQTLMPSLTQVPHCSPLFYAYGIFVISAFEASHKISYYPVIICIFIFHKCSEFFSYASLTLWAFCALLPLIFTSTSLMS